MDKESWEALLERVRKLDQEYFGNRDIKQLLWAMDAQVTSMLKEPTRTNVHKQLGDLLFVVVAAARNNNLEVDELLNDAVVKLENRREGHHYYEAHVTVEPVFEDRLEWLKALALEHRFHIAELVMQKRPGDTPERSRYDAFCTGRSVSYSDLDHETCEFVRLLQHEGFKVWRGKIESTIWDSRYDDSRCPLIREDLPEKERNPRAPAPGALPGRKDP